MASRDETPQELDSDVTESNLEWIKFKHKVLAEAPLRLTKKGEEKAIDFVNRFEKRFKGGETRVWMGDLILLDSLGLIEFPLGFPKFVLHKLSRRFGRRVNFFIRIESDKAWLSEVCISKSILELENSQELIGSIIDKVLSNYTPTPAGNLRGWFGNSEWSVSLEMTEDHLVIHFDREEQVGEDASQNNLG